MIQYSQDHKDSIKGLLDLIHTLKRVAGYKIHKQKSVASMHQYKHTEKEVRKQSHSQYPQKKKRCKSIQGGE
jgi:hypothetical protein